MIIETIESQCDTFNIKISLSCRYLSWTVRSIVSFLFQSPQISLLVLRIRYFSHVRYVLSVKIRRVSILIAS